MAPCAIVETRATRAPALSARRRARAAGAAPRRAPARAGAGAGVGAALEWAKLAAGGALLAYGLLHPHAAGAAELVFPDAATQETLQRGFRERQGTRDSVAYPHIHSA